MDSRGFFGGGKLGENREGDNGPLQQRFEYDTDAVFTCIEDFIDCGTSNIWCSPSPLFYLPTFLFAPLRSFLLNKRPILAASRNEGL